MLVKTDKRWEKPTEITAENELDTMFWYLLDDSQAQTTREVVVGDSVAKMLSFMFQVPMPGDGGGLGYQFPQKDVEAINSMLDGARMDELGRGMVRISTLVLLANSPKCPYVVEINRTLCEGRTVSYYSFILRRDIVRQNIIS